MRLTSRTAVVALAAASLLAAGCGSSGKKAGGTASTAAKPAAGGASTAAATPAAKKGGTLTIAILDGPKSFAAFDGELGNRAIYFQAPYDTLLHIEADGKLSPWLATEYKYNADLTQLTLKLKDGVKFTDGQAFNADAAAKNLTRYKASKGIGAPLVSLMSEAKAVDASTVQITLSAPDPGFLTYLGGPAGMMESPAMFDKPEEATNPVGTGPYILDPSKTVAGSAYAFKANPDYWNKASGIVKYDNLLVKVISDAAAVANALKAGEIDGANVTSPDLVKDLKAAGLTLQSQELDWSGLTMVDRDGKLGSPFKDVKVRQAINYAIDRDAILKGNGAGLGTVTTQVFRAASPAYDPALDTFYKYDPTKAKALLAEAGYPNGFDLEMATVPGLGDTISALLKDQLGAVGIKVNWVSTPISDYFGAILGPKYPSFYMQLEQNPNDWVAINFLVSKAAIWNPTKYGDSTTDDLIAKIQKSTDADRPALLKQLNKYIVEQAWFAPFYRVQMNFATNAKTDVKIQTGNAYPFLWNFSPKG